MSRILRGYIYSVGYPAIMDVRRGERIETMKVLAFIVAATIFEAVGDAVMRIALHYHVMPWRVVLFACATALLGTYGLFLNLAPTEFTTATGIYLASLFVAFQGANYVFFKLVPSAGVMTGGALIVAGAAVVYFWR